VRVRASQVDFKGDIASTPGPPNLFFDTSVPGWSKAGKAT